jgi:hypothetical protein
VQPIPAYALTLGYLTSPRIPARNLPTSPYHFHTCISVHFYSVITHVIVVTTICNTTVLHFRKTVTEEPLGRSR